MSNHIPATCEGGVVTAAGVPVEGAVILSEGVGESSGVLHLDAARAFYVPKTSPDLKETLTRLIEALNAAKSGLDGASSALSALGPVADGVLGPIAVAPGVAAIGSASGTLASVSSALSELKDNLR